MPSSILQVSDDKLIYHCQNRQPFYFESRLITDWLAENSYCLLVSGYLRYLLVVATVSVTRDRFAALFVDTCYCTGQGTFSMRTLRKRVVI